jgi:hypothetical protein
VYLCAVSSSSRPKRIYIIVLHCAQYFIPFLCVSHHIVGVAFNMTSRANNLYCLGTCNSNDFSNMSISVIPSYLGGSRSSVPIQRNDQFIRAHHLVDTSCILYYQFSGLASESDAHELILLQLSTPFFSYRHNPPYAQSDCIICQCPSLLLALCIVVLLMGPKVQ